MKLTCAKGLGAGQTVSASTASMESTPRTSRSAIFFWRSLPSCAKRSDLVLELEPNGRLVTRVRSCGWLLITAGLGLSLVGLGVVGMARMDSASPPLGLLNGRGKRHRQRAIERHTPGQHHSRSGQPSHHATCQHRRPNQRGGHHVGQADPTV